MGSLQRPRKLACELGRFARHDHIEALTHTEFRNFAELRAAFPSADRVAHWIVFNLGGDKYRLIASIHFNRGKVYIRHVLTHREYDQEGWKR